MLILGRKPGEIIKIGDNIIVKLLDIRDNHVRLGIDAPDEIVIARGEIADNFQKRLVPSS